MLRMSAAVTRGSLIVFEGVDRSGKSTQCRRLAERLLGEGRKCELLRFPGTAPAPRALSGRTAALLARFTAALDANCDGAQIEPPQLAP